MSVDFRKAKAAYQQLAQKARQEYQAITNDSAYTVMLGTATCGRSAGALEVLDAFREQMQASEINGQVLEVGCMGHCYAEPMAVCIRPGFPPMVYHHLNSVIARNLIKRFFQEGEPLLEYLLGATQPNETYPSLQDLPRYGREKRCLLSRCGIHDPASLEQALALDAYAGFIRALELGPDQVIQILRQSGLRGLGGAGFLVWKKWE